MQTIKNACVQIEVIPLGVYQTNVYIISDGTSLFVVDPGANFAAIKQALGSRKPDAIVITHYHTDHIGAACDMREFYKAPVYASSIDARVIETSQPADIGLPSPKPCKVDFCVNDNDVITVGDMKLHVLLTPGHTPGGICLFLDSNEYSKGGNSVLIAGDTLFYTSMGRTDFPGGSPSDMTKSLRRLAKLPDETIVLPGHGPFTTIKAERRYALSM